MASASAFPVCHQCSEAARTERNQALQQLAHAFPGCSCLPCPEGEPPRHPARPPWDIPAAQGTLRRGLCSLGVQCVTSGPQKGLWVSDSSEAAAAFAVFHLIRCLRQGTGCSVPHFPPAGHAPPRRTLPLVPPAQSMFTRASCLQGVQAPVLRYRKICRAQHGQTWQPPTGPGSAKGPAVAAPAHLGRRRGEGTCAATACSTEAPGEQTLSQTRENTSEYIAALP